MGLLDRYSSTSTNEEQATQSAFANHESSDKIRPALEDRYSDVKARIHSMIIEQQLGSDNADVSEEGMRKLIDEYVERPDFLIYIHIPCLCLIIQFQHLHTLFLIQ